MERWKLTDILTPGVQPCALHLANGVSYSFHLLSSGLVNPKCPNLSSVVAHIPTFFKVLVVGEGANALLLDLDRGSYLYVISSSTGISGIVNGLSFDIRKIDEVMSVVRSYTTRRRIYADALAQWPTQALRPDYQFQDVLRKAVDERFQSYRPSMEAEEVQRARALQILIQNKFRDKARELFSIGFLRRGEERNG
ncbi:hypothetical protein L249_0655 [Ophiocordyceps polyrhachis-furcata BCC 54312]|uniref:Uncharacterized protein n=1 Tax=Ophiocordyceps polyrhachis-furcata BCC 54312 TaxID=1330021 RepID=A0A367LFU4_9HYPO|nr:hypothetical protein L249_0655 [Ophiocordyceps polyrhachis-furcata BCC 54312]